MDLHDHPQLRDTRQATDSILFCLDSSMEPFLGHLVILILLDVVVIFRLSYFEYIDSHIIILVGCMSNLLYIPVELFSSCQDRSDISDAIWGHISLL